MLFLLYFRHIQHMLIQRENSKLWKGFSCFPSAITSESVRSGWITQAFLMLLDSKHEIKANVAVSLQDQEA